MEIITTVKKPIFLLSSGKNVPFLYFLGMKSDTRMAFRTEKCLDFLSMSLGFISSRVFILDCQSTNALDYLQ